MKKYLKRLKKRLKSGFTLVEVIISCALLGVLVVAMTSFVTPVLNLATGEEESVRARVLSETLSDYIDRSIKNALFIKMFDIDREQQSVIGNYYDIKDSDLVKMYKKSDGKAGSGYSMRCIGLVWNDDPQTYEYKYMLTVESIERIEEGGEVTGIRIKCADRYYVFEDCFYDGLFPDINIDKARKSSTYDETGKEVLGEQVNTAIKTEASVYENTEMTELAVVGTNYTDFLNMKLAVERKAETDKIEDVAWIYDKKAIGNTDNHPDKFIFYVIRELSAL